jgi:phosphinothricin acetyltransferase
MEMLQAYPAYVVKDGAGDVVGFGFLRPFHPGSALRRTAEITYFIHPEHTRRGLGGMLLGRLMEEARKLGVDNLVANISSRNEQSLGFHRRQGFVERGRLKEVGRKFGEAFDVVWMQRSV